MIGQAVFDHAHGDIPAHQPLRHVLAFVDGRNNGVSTAGADHDHLSVALLGKIEVEAGFIADVGDASPVVDGDTAGQAVVFTGTERDIHPFFLNALAAGRVLAFGVKEDRPGRL